MQYNRNFYRIEYPLTERPKLLWNGRTWDVVNIAEKGLRFIYSGEMPLERNISITGVILFRNGDAYDIKGEVVWNKDSDIALHLVQGIPFKKIFDEQRYLIHKKRKLTDEDMDERVHYIDETESEHQRDWKEYYFKKMDKRYDEIRNELPGFFQ